MLKRLKTYLGQQRRNFKLMKFHMKQSKSKHPDANKRIIVCFNGQVPHGGLVDRLKGIISFYDVARQLNYDFFIQFSHPFNLDLFLEPNAFEWRIDETETGLSKTTQLINVINQFDLDPLELIKSSSKQTFLVYANIDYLSKTNPTKSGKALEHLWRTHFNHLFKQSSQLKKALLDLEPEPYISIHTRFTSIMGDFQDSTSLIISEEERTVLLEQLKVKIDYIQSTHVEKVYVFSDSSLFLSYALQNTTTQTVKGTPFHMDSYTSQAEIEAHLKTLVDFFMIAESQNVYFLKINPMYSSAFSKYAAIIGNKPFIKIEA
ncbi:hypothetical protein C7H52_12730 [Aurantibacter aestuarii]|uniref:Uncharacterized protein n=2 Tax=Aurantibacter aestuarii TaxID=1266046 RepID=A0A2T1N5I0_9FLAO|nr:hypothetical protein C7H52_12730 [Aurantibacter aestuarii]